MSYYGSILCTPIIVGSSSTLVHKMDPYIYSITCPIMGPSYVHRLLRGLTLVHKMDPYIYGVIHSIMGPSYVHRFLRGLTLVHKMVPLYVWCHTGHLMYTNDCGVLPLYIRWSLYIYVWCHDGAILCTPDIVGSFSPFTLGIGTVLEIIGVHKMAP